MLIRMRLFLALTALLATIVGLAAPATAATGIASHVPQKGGILVWNSGQKIFTSGPLPEPYRSFPALAGWQAGYYCDITGVFWSYFSVRNCQPAAIKGDSVIDQDGDPELAAAIEAAYPTMTRGFWDHYGWMILLAGVVVLTGLGIAKRTRQKSSTPAVAPESPASEVSGPTGPTGPTGPAES